ncbi:hypothetical protein KIN20_005641 [Parelaphostrongylus tenuis]|uniref:ABC transporter domain-containing protein n=1 Tax=Parelaphostrongylus tenuis TaxID=148309 RepID=A0AAD5MJ82_PARTN|nr:hypothetical protein KIN20_005641 [Parelaphostrongylus tenuis]
MESQARLTYVAMTAGENASNDVRSDHEEFANSENTRETMVKSDTEAKLSDNRTIQVHCDDDDDDEVSDNPAEKSTCEKFVNYCYAAHTRVYFWEGVWTSHHWKYNTPYEYTSKTKHGWAVRQLGEKIKISESTSKELKDIGKAGAIAEESVLGVRTVQALNGQEEMVARFGGHLLEIGAVQKTGDVVTVVISMMLGAYFLGLISPHLMVLLNARVSAAVIYDIIDRTPHIDVYSTEGKFPMDMQGDIQFENVHFHYPTRKDIKVLNGISFKIHAGETVAFVGHSGCGKSTAVGLITRLYEAESGTVKIGGYDVRDLNLEWLRNAVGIVQQEPTLFSGTIEENVRVGNPDITTSEIIEVCKAANAHEFITKLPMGYSTVIGDGAVQLSGGQKQRIAIARTLARNPQILLLDEATSALDANSERTHQELVDLDGRYARLVRAQQFQSEDDDDFLSVDTQED